jgi:transposase
MPNYIPIDRAQMEWGVVDLESLVEADHPVRAIWEMSGRLDLSQFEQGIQNEGEEGGRPCWPPRLLFSVWVYGYSQGIASARAL